MSNLNKFNLSHRKAISCDVGELVPIGMVHVNPGDIFRHSTACLVRTLPLMAPLMHKLDVRIHHWFVPNRIVWSQWEQFITGGTTGNDATVHPYIDLPNSGSGGVVQGSLANYLGIPTGYNADNSGYRVNALPFRAYDLIWNEFYRDQGLSTPLTINLGSGADTTTSTALQRIMWEKDYFTAARPTPQLGNDVTISLGSTAPVERVSGTSAQPKVYQLGGNTVASNQTLAAQTATGNLFVLAVILHPIS